MLVHDILSIFYISDSKRTADTLDVLQKIGRSYTRLVIFKSCFVCKSSWASKGEGGGIFNAQGDKIEQVQCVRQQNGEGH